jgi:Flp pilus assembly pilin Flp
MFKLLPNYIVTQFNRFYKNEKGMGTIEIVIIIAVLIGLAFLFKTFAVDFFTKITQGISENNDIDSLFN